jgi:protein phosphatase 1 regulatory subunit 11
LRLFILGRPETYGSRTMTIHPEELAEEIGPVSSEEESDLSTQPVGTLKLRGDGDGQSSNRKVKWDDTVVDNEGLGRKKSKSMYKIITNLLFFHELII